MQKSIRHFSRIGKIISKINIVKWFYYPNHSTGSTNPYQTISSAFHRVRAKNFKICMETQETLTRQINLEGQKKKSERNQSSCLQTILQSNSHQYSMVLPKKQKYRPMEQDRKPRDKAMQPWAPWRWQRRKEYTMAKRWPLQYVFLGKLYSYT